MQVETCGMGVEDVYRAAVDVLWNTTYRKKFLQLLARIGEVFQARGWRVEEPWEASDEEYSFALPVYLGNVACDVQLYLVESLCREGSLDGVAFSLNLGAPCGHVIGVMTPYNYSEELWVPVTDTEAVLERWRLFEELEAEDVVDVLWKHVDGCEAARK